MFFSKSFGYAVRGVLYISLMHDENRKVQVEEIASKLSVPRHFMGKILKRLVKEKIIFSVKGPSGGFITNEHTLRTPLIRLLELTEGMEAFSTCMLQMKECNSKNPCPLHHVMETLRKQLRSALSETTIQDLLQENKSAFIKSISADVVAIR